MSDDTGRPGVAVSYWRVYAGTWIEVWRRAQHDRYVARTARSIARDVTALHRAIDAIHARLSEPDNR